MWRQALIGLGVVLSSATVAFGQAADTPYQVRAIANLKPHDSIVVSNSGASSTVPSPQNGSLCANVYALSAATGLLVDCCACRVGPNALVSIPVVSDILANPKKRPKAIMLKLLASIGNDGGVCDAGNVGMVPNVLTLGMLVWKDQIPFTPATLGAAELAHLTEQCAGLHDTGNICPICVPQ